MAFFHQNISLIFVIICCVAPNNIWNRSNVQSYRRVGPSDQHRQQQPKKNSYLKWFIFACTLYEQTSKINSCVRRVFRNGWAHSLMLLALLLHAFIHWAVGVFRMCCGWWCIVFVALIFIFITILWCIIMGVVYSQRLVSVCDAHRVKLAHCVCLCAEMLCCRSWVWFL